MKFPINVQNSKFQTTCLNSYEIDFFFHLAISRISTCQSLLGHVHHIPHASLDNLASPPMWMPICNRRRSIVKGWFVFPLLETMLLLSYSTLNQSKLKYRLFLNIVKSSQIIYKCRKILVLDCNKHLLLSNKLW